MFRLLDSFPRLAVRRVTLDQIGHLALPLCLSTSSHILKSPSLSLSLSLLFLSSVVLSVSVSLVYIMQYCVGRGATVLHCGLSGVGVCLVNATALRVKGQPVDQGGGRGECVCVCVYVCV